MCLKDIIQMSDLINSHLQKPAKRKSSEHVLSLPVWGDNCIIKNLPKLL